MTSTLLSEKIEQLKARRDLPVWKHRQSIIDTVKNAAVTIVTGETGCGKTTQIPQFLLSSGIGKCIAVTQPRRISAISLAQRVSKEQGSTLGDKVGYSVRFDNRSCTNTKIKFLTDGMLLRELLISRTLDRYNVIVLDEVHERSLRTDMLLGMIKRILQKRSDLKVLIMSATLDSDFFTNFFTGACRLHIPGRLHDIRVFNVLSPVTDYVEGALRTIYNLHQQKPIPGDILAFFNGQEDIEAACLLLNEYQSHYPNLRIVPLFAHLPLSKQKQVFDPIPKGYRKVVLATNIAETSVTIPGVLYVIDHGLAKLKIHHPRTGLESLEVSPISKFSALQRAGRAGREAPGQVYRLYTEESFDRLEYSTSPEIQRANLSTVILQLLAAGVDDIRAFDYIERPSKDALIDAHSQLVMLGAIDTTSRLLTTTGYEMAKYPLDPAVSRILVDARARSCITIDLLTILALLSQDTLFYTPSSGDARDLALDKRQKFISSDGDLITWLNVVRAYEDSTQDESWCKDHYVNMRTIRQVLNVRKQLVNEVGTKSIMAHLATPEELLPQFLRGYFNQIAFLQPTGKYLTCTGRHEVSIHPSSVLFDKRNIDVISFVDMTSADTGRWYLRGVSRMNMTWIQEAHAAIHTQTRSEKPSKLN